MRCARRPDERDLRFVQRRTKSGRLHLSAPNVALSTLFRSYPRVPEGLGIGGVADAAGGRAAQLGVYQGSIDIADLLISW